MSDEEERWIESGREEDAAFEWTDIFAGKVALVRASLASSLFHILKLNFTISQSQIRSTALTFCGRKTMLKYPFN
jgi:hypothetical protein